jgi:hypothetical protein
MGNLEVHIVTTRLQRVKTCREYVVKARCLLIFGTERRCASLQGNRRRYLLGRKLVDFFLDVAVEKIIPASASIKPWSCQPHSVSVLSDLLQVTLRFFCCYFVLVSELDNKTRMITVTNLYKGRLLIGIRNCASMFHGTLLISLKNRINCRINAKEET